MLKGYVYEALQEESMIKDLDGMIRFIIIGISFLRQIGGPF